MTASIARFAALSTGLLLCLGGVAQAEDFGESEFAKAGVYAGGGATIAIEDSSRQGVQDTVGANLFVGYRVLPRLAFEAQTEWLEGARLDDKKNGSHGGLEGWIFTANTRLYMTSARVQPFLLGGLGFIHSDGGVNDNNTDFAMRAGLGFEIHIVAGLSAVVSGSYLAGFNDVVNFDYGSVQTGLQYNF